jgi:hypothetical protein
MDSGGTIGGGLILASDGRLGACRVFSYTRGGGGGSPTRPFRTA